MSRLVLLCSIGLFGFGAALAEPTPSFTNPLSVHAEGVGAVTSCADPTLLRSRVPGDDDWVMICTSDPLNGDDRNAQGALIHRRLPMFRSEDLVTWSYVGDALSLPPVWAESWANLWAPELVEHAGIYYLYFTVTDTRYMTSGELGCFSDSAIGVATASSPTGPWTIHDEPVVPPRRLGAGCDFATTYDPDLVEDPGSSEAWLFFGGYRGGIAVRRLEADWLGTVETSEHAVASERYEGAEVFHRDGHHYLFASPNGCCNGDLTGYSVMVGRADALTGPYLDRSGQDLLEARSGGSWVLGPTGGAYVGHGHVSVFEDANGLSYMAYHAIETARPFFAGEDGFTRRPVLLDALSWDEDGWPLVAGGWGSVECEQSAPAAQEGMASAPYDARRVIDAPGALLPAYSDTFDAGLEEEWEWVRPPADSQWAVETGELRIATSASELHENANSAPVLLRPAPEGDFVVESALRFDVPASGGGHDYAQAGLVLYADDDRYLKLVHVAIGGTRQVEFGKELPARGSGWPRYGGSSVGAPGARTELRLAVRRVAAGLVAVSPYTRADGGVWERGSTWTHELGGAFRIGLVAMNRAGYTARFEHFSAYALEAYPCEDVDLRDPCRPTELGEVMGVAVEASEEGWVLRWDALWGASAYDVSVSALNELGPGDYGSCLARAHAGTRLALEPSGEAGEGYLVRGADAFCGRQGSWGAGRVNENPAACP